MNIGLFFGSFNPFHVGHKIIASYIRDFTKVQQVWFVVSPQSPMKTKKSLLDQHHRLMIIKMEKVFMNLPMVVGVKEIFLKGN